MTWQAPSARHYVEGGAEMSNRAKFRALPVDNQIMRRITDGQLCATLSQAGREARKLRNREVGPAKCRPN
jgi:GTP-binding protein